MAYHLKTRIAVAVSFLTMFFLILISWLSHLYFTKEFKATAFRHISDSLEVTAAHLSIKAHQALHKLELIRDSIPYHIMGDPVEMQGFLDGLDTELIHFDNGIILYSPEGRLLAVNPKQEDVIGVDFSFRDYIKITLLNRQPYISAPIKSRQSHHHPIIVITEPVFSPDDKISGILAGSFDLYSSNFLNPLISNRIGQNGYYMILDQQETMLIHPAKENILRPASDFFPREQIVDFLLNSHGLIPGVTMDGAEMIGAFKHISPLNWTLVALVPASEIYKPIQQARVYTVMALTTLFILTIIAIRTLTNRLITPLTELTEEVQHLASGKEAALSLQSEQYEELGTLSKSIEILVNELGQKRRSLREQLMFLQNLIDTIPSPIFYKDDEFRYIGCNKAFEEYIGIPKDQLRGKSVFEIAPPELAKVYHQADIDLWVHGEEQCYEASVKYADESIHDVIFYKKIFKDIQDKPAGMIGMFFDITDRKKSEGALQISEHRFRLLVENAADAFLLHNEKGQILDVNQQACNSLGYSRETLLDMRILDVSMDYGLDEVRELIERLRKEHIVSLEDRHRRKDGSSFPVEVRLCYTEQDGGMIIALARDITERKHYEAMLENALIDAQAAKQQVDNILKSAADGIVVTNKLNRITHFNQVAEEMLGFKTIDVIGKPFTTLFKNKALREQAHEFIKTENPDIRQSDFKLNLSDAEETKIVEARSSVLLGDDGKHYGVVTLLRDVTRDRELDQIKSEFISTAAHEMRTPLSIIMGYIEMLRDSEMFGGFSADDEKQFLDEAYNKSEALTQIIDDLFDISRIEAGLPLPLTKSESDINKIIHGIASHYAKNSSKHEFEIDLSDNALAFVDANKMSQVFVNLISNAVKYSPDGGLIKVKTSEEEDHLLIEIEDYGKGMTEEQLERIFDKFYRADSSNTAIAGLGLGMSIVKTIIEAHNGVINVASTPGKGTSVTIKIPRQKP